MVLFDLLGRRWALGIIWTLADGPKPFRRLQEHCESVSPSVLNTRLRELRQSGLVERQPAGYALTPRGQELFGRLRPLGQWAIAWADELGDRMGDQMGDDRGGDRGGDRGDKSDGH